MRPKPQAGESQGDSKLTTDLDIYRIANELIKQHGNDALIHAATRVDELLSEEVPDGAAVN